MTIPKPDLSRVDPEIQAYISLLEKEIEDLKASQALSRRETDRETWGENVTKEGHGQALLSGEVEPPTTINLISATASWVIKRTPRHLYARQRRGGMGVFDLDTAEDDPARCLCAAEENQTLLLLTNLARVFRLPVSMLPESPVRSKGNSQAARFVLEAEEQLVFIIPEQAQGYLAATSQGGFVRMLRHHVFGEYMKPGTVLFDTRLHGPLAGACWSPGDGDFLLATRQAKAIRFNEKQVPPAGVQGIRLDADDCCIAICPVNQSSQVFFLGSDGKGTIRAMENFNANKAPGSGGKQAMNASALIAARSLQDEEDLFIISQLSKFIRFSASETPAKEGVVQGVVCMTLRADQPVAMTSSRR